jgi:WD40 repeat protein
VKSIEEHNSGVNQMMRINQKELVTVSDDCTLKFWSASSLKIESQIMTETITCISSTGSLKKEILVAGCHSGNLILINSLTKTKKETMNNAHYNLIRVIVSLESLKNKYFVTADVCGIVKVW